MSQEQEPTLITARKQRTRRRAPRPVLVTNSEIEQELHTDALETPATALAETQTEPLAESAVAIETKPTRPTRRPVFFSRVAKEETETAAPADEIAKARLARATRNGKAQAASKSEVKEETKADSKPKAASKPAPPRLFKPRHFIGMAIYLFGAQFILPVEYTFANQIGLEKVLFKIPLFGQQLPIDTSLFLNIATLIILLYALVKFDLLPSTLTARTAAEQRARERTRQNQGNSQPVEKPAPLAIRQGVKGSDDDLYQAYRQGQRREKKR